MNDNLYDTEYDDEEDDGNDEPVPEVLENPDWSALTRMVEEGMAYISINRRAPKDWDHYVFEEALSAIYGDDIWEWYNRKVI